MPIDLTIEDQLNEHMAQARAIREGVPPLPLARGAVVEPPQPMTQLEFDDERKSFLDRAAEALGVVGKGILRPLTFAAEQLERSQDIFQATVLTAFGRIPLKEYPNYVKTIFNGERRVGGKEFWQLAVGHSLYEQLNRMPLIPGWTRDIVAPDPVFGRTTTKTPVLSLAKVLGGVTELFLDPFAAMAVVPRGFFTATRVGRLLAKAGLDPTTSPLTYPLRKTAAIVISKRIPGLSALLFHALDPDFVMPGAIADSWKLAGKGLEDRADFWADAFNKIVKKHLPNQARTSLARRGVGRITPQEGLAEANLARVYNKLFLDAGKTMTGGEQALVDDLMEQVIRPLHKRLKDMGYDRQRVRVGKDSKLVVWDPERDLLTKFHGTPRDYLLRPSSPGAKEFNQRVRTTIAWKSQRIPYDPAKLHTRNRDPFHAVEQWVDQAERLLILEERERAVGGGWRLIGPLLRFRPTAESRARNTNPLLRELDNDTKWSYFLEKVHDFTGNRAGRKEIAADNVMANFWQGVNENVASLARRNRMFKWMLRKANGATDANGLPQLPKLQRIAGVMTANTVIAALGLNLASALKNTSQLINTATVKGVPATFKGLYRMVDVWSSDGKSLQQLRRAANFKNTHRRLVLDETWGRGFRTTFDNMVMGPFNMMENWMRGITFNVSVGERMKALKMVGLDDFKKLATVRGTQTAPRSLRRIIEEGIIEAQYANHTYGIAGRSHFMMSSVARVGFALQSYSWKQAEFMSKVWRSTDGGSAMLRMVGLNGWLIEIMDRFAGVNAENWLGWGFTPPSTLGRGPFFDAMINVGEMILAFGEDNSTAHDRAVDGLRGNIREIARSFGDPDQVIGIQAGVAAASLAGFLPIPVVGVGRTFKAINEFTTGIRERNRGRTWQRVRRFEAVKSWFVTTHRQAEDRRLAEMERGARRQVDGELDRRVRAYLKAAQGSDGNELMQASRRLASPITLKVPVTGIGARPLRAAFFRLGDDRSFWPHGEMIESRLRRLAQGATVSGDVREMLEAGWLLEVYWAEYSNRAFRELDRGAILGLKEGQ